MAEQTRRLSVDENIRQVPWWRGQSRQTGSGCKSRRLTLYIIFARRHSTSSESIVCPPLASCIAALNSETGTRVLRTGAVPGSFGSSNPPPTNTFRSRLRNAMSRPRSNVRYILYRTSSSSLAWSASSKALRSPFLIHDKIGMNRRCRFGYDSRSLLLGSVCVVRRWQGMR